MKTIYLNSEYQCYTSKQENTVLEIETDVFDKKCDTFIQGMRFIPQGESWTRQDGTVFTGEMIAPFKDSSMLIEIQDLYDEIQKQQVFQNSEISYIGMMTEVL